MKIASGLAGALILGVAVSASAADADVVKTITDLEAQWAKGEATNKPELIAPLLSDRLTVVETGGKVLNKAEFLVEEKSVHYLSSAVDELKVEVFGDTAIAVYGLTQKYTVGGKTIDRHVRETDTWVKGPKGNWQVVAASGTPIDKT